MDAPASYWIWLGDGFDRLTERFSSIVLPLEEAAERPREGDTVFLWEGGLRGALRGRGRVLDIQEAGGKVQRLEARLAIDLEVTPGVPSKEVAAAVPGLEPLLESGTTFVPVPEPVAAALGRFVGSRSPSETPDLDSREWGPSEVAPGDADLEATLQDLVGAALDEGEGAPAESDLGETLQEAPEQASKGSALRQASQAVRLWPEALRERGYVERVQGLLRAVGYELTADGALGQATLDAVRAFQRAVGLPADGIAGPQTIEALERASAPPQAPPQKAPPAPPTNLRLTETPEELAGYELEDDAAAALGDALTAARSVEGGTGPPLTSSLLLYGVLSQASRTEQGAVRAFADTLYTPAAQQAAEDYLSRKRGMGTGGASAAVIHVFERAQRLAELTTGQPRIGLRHLLGVLLSITYADGGPGARWRLREAGHDPVALARAYFVAVTKDFPSDKPAFWLRVLLGEARPLLPAYDTDGALRDGQPLLERDRLGIENDVKAFAKLIAATSVEPPLSIGLFGDWGSGKTFFMRCLQEAVADLARQARAAGQPQHEVPYFKHVVQIEFNAWHYVESNLWASMVEHILDNLRIAPEETAAGQVRARQEHYLQKLREAKDDARLYEGALREAEAEEQAAQERLRLAEDALRERRQERAGAAERLATYARAAADVLREEQLVQSAEGDAKTLIAEARKLLKEVGAAEAKDAVKELQGQLEAAERSLSWGRALLASLVGGPHAGRRLLLFGLFLVGFPLAIALVTYGLSQRAWLAEVGALVSAVAALVGGLAQAVKSGAERANPWLRKGQQAADWVARAERVWRRIQAAAAQRRGELAGQMAAEKEALAQAEADVRAAQERAERARADLLQAQREVRARTPAQLLAHYIEARTASDDYRKHLGVLALIRRDFEKLSDLVDLQNRRLMGAAAAPDDPSVSPEDVRINRIVLYIDDLDRCPAERVAEVMQAVHLLLAFPLFVVVVGVDARWLTRSLSTHYRGLLGQDGTRRPRRDRPKATPFDYLEKIFQIPLWLNPMTEMGTRDLIGSMLGRSLTSEPSAPSAAEEGDGFAGDGVVARLAGATAEGGPPRSAERAAGADSEGAPADAAASESERVPADRAVGAAEPVAPPTQREPRREEATTLDLSPRALDVKPVELDFIQSLAVVVGRSPRAVKRFVNTYRLIKAGLGPHRRAAFMEERGAESEFRARLLLLAVVAGLPALAPAFLGAVSDPTGGAESLEGLVGKLDPPSRAARQECERLTAWLSRHSEWSQVRAKVLAPHVGAVARYSFRAVGHGTPSES